MNVSIRNRIRWLYILYEQQYPLQNNKECIALKLQADLGWRRDFARKMVQQALEAVTSRTAE